MANIDKSHVRSRRKYNEIKLDPRAIDAVEVAPDHESSEIEIIDTQIEILLAQGFDRFRWVSKSPPNLQTDAVVSLSV